MVLKAFCFFVALSVAHELVTQYDHDHNELHMDELSITQLLRMFYDSNGVVMGLPDDSFTANLEYNDKHGAIYSRIGAAQVDGMAQAWCGKTGKNNEITVDLTTSALVTGVATQGRGDHNGWVTRYSIATSENGVIWQKHGNFMGNFDQETICHSRFERPVAARFVKLSVLEHKMMACLRWDILVLKM